MITWEIAGFQNRTRVEYPDDELNIEIQKLEEDIVELLEVNRGGESNEFGIEEIREYLPRTLFPPIPHS